MTVPTKPTKPKKITGKEKLPAAAAAQEQTTADLAANYQWSLALLNSSPELQKLFRQAVKNGWTGPRFAAELQDTSWFQKHAASWRTNEIQRLTDPATWNAARKSNRATVEDAAAKMGAVLTGPQMKRLADDAMALGWTEAQMQNHLGEYIKLQKTGPNSGMYGGNAGQQYTALKQAALRNGYEIPKGSIDQWLGSIAKGDSTVDDYAQMMRRQAAAAYPSLKDELLAGADLDDLAAPYRQTMSRLLEIPPERIDLNDTTLRKGLSQKDSKGNHTTMPLYDYEDEIRKDSRWQYTQNAKDSIMSRVLKIGQNFGKTG